MKILLTIIVLIILGLIYFMHKSRKGTLNLNVNSWHFKLLHWMWDVEKYELKNSCPYYWTLVCTILLLPVVLIIYPFYRFFSWIKSKLPKRKPKLTKKKNLKIPSTKPEWFKLFYTKGERIIKNILFILLIILIFGGTLLIYLLPFIQGHSYFGIILIGITIIIIGSAYLVDNYSEYNKYHYDVYCNFLKGIKGLLLMFPILLWELLKYIGKKIGITYKNHCPPINWN